MAQKMTDMEWWEFVSYGTRTAKLSTVRADGSPHVAPIWLLLDGDEVVFNTGSTSVKGRNLARDGRVALCVDDDRPPFDFVVHTSPSRAEPVQPTESSSRAVCIRPAYSTSRISTSFPESRSRASQSTTGVPLSRSRARETSWAP